MILKNEKGQMAIFIALFFQVLFVFFAMAINVGLVVHDKINLQNAVDLAAYYGAAKQAEVLNQIAHVNYQMRQNYKLFTYRYRVLGTIGNIQHPLNNENNGVANPDEPSFERLFPSVCTAHFFWQEYRNLDGNANFCRYPERRIPNIRPATGGAGFIGAYQNLVNYTQMVNLQIQDQCREMGIFNWLFAARVLAHFRVDGLVRKRKIRRLAENLSSPNFRDIRGGSVQEGVRQTFELNLTEANRVGIADFQYFNSMSSGECANPEYWLPEIRINPVIMFTDLRASAEGCDPENVANREMDDRATNLPWGFDQSPQMFAALGAPNQILIDHWMSEPAASTGLHSSIGFEKNPWCMVYSGVTATTQVRKPFSPTGGTVTLQARGFAQPFGGRIGPWYGRTWPQGAANSQAGSRNEMIDPLLPSRDVAGGSLSSVPAEDIANHSRFPGENPQTGGYNSMGPFVSMLQAFRGQITQAATTTPGAGTSPLAWATYNHLGGQPSLEQTGDSLARQSQVGGTGMNSAPQRAFELGAIAPDPFDALYYSVEPAYFYNYFSPAAANNGALFSDNEKVYDLGSTKDGGHPGATQEFGIVGQVQNVTQVYDNNYPHILRNWHHLLTSWHQRSASNYSMDPQRFGRCEVEISDPNLPTTGNCIQGGRIGYSVKNVSRDFLLSGEHSLGGGTGITGSILNPPNF
jgi:hypothetical protein